MYRASTKPRGVSARWFGAAAVLAAVSTLTVAGAAITAPAAFATQRYYSTTNGLTLRTGPGTGYGSAGTVAKNGPLDIVCQVQGGTNVNGNTDWDRLTSGYWVADYWTSTPTFNASHFPAPGTYDCNRPPTTPGVTAQMQAAANWAIAEKNSPDPTWSDHFGHQWSGWCEQFVEQAEGFKFTFPTALADYQWEANNGRIHTDANPPVGALVFYGTGASPSGHVAVSIGGGQAVGTIGNGSKRLPVSQYAVVGFVSNYLGWALPIGS